jgi:hypothetical protein
MSNLICGTRILRVIRVRITGRQPVGGMRQARSLSY